jgi:hypothetical protein
MKSTIHDGSFVIDRLGNFLDKGESRRYVP